MSKAMDMNAKGILCLIVVLVVAWYVVTMISTSNATSNPVEELTPQINDMKQKPEKIEFILYQLVKAQKRDDFAEVHGLYLKDDKVRIVIELNNTEVFKIENILKRYDGIMETYYGNLVQALVPVDNLIALSEETTINFIRTPLPAHPQENQHTNDSGTNETPGFTSIMTILTLGVFFMLILFKKRGDINKRR